MAVIGSQAVLLIGRKRWPLIGAFRSDFDEQSGRSNSELFQLLGCILLVKIQLSYGLRQLLINHTDRVRPWERNLSFSGLVDTAGK